MIFSLYHYGIVVWLDYSKIDKNMCSDKSICIVLWLAICKTYEYIYIYTYMEIICIYVTEA